MWDLLHACSFLLDGSSLDEIVRPLKTLLPCRYCRESFVVFYEQLGRPNGAKSDPEVPMWVYRAHELVNRKLSVQKAEAFVKKNKVVPQVAKVMLRYASEVSQFQPSFEVVQKRFMVHRDEPITWTSLSVVLLAITMGLECNDGAKANIGPFYAEFVTFMVGLKTALKASKQSNQAGLMEVLDRCIGLCASGAPIQQLRGLLETMKYTHVVKNGSASSCQELSGLIKAGACIKGTCA